MADPLRVLILEDRPDDAELMLVELRRAGFEPAWVRVDNVPDYLAQLDAAPEIILADYGLPQFDALLALHLLQVRELDVPFIIVTGSISEEVAVECMKQGAADYLLKDRLARLGQAVTQGLEKKRLRDAQRRTEAALRASELRFRQLVESVKDYAIYMLDIEGRIVTWNSGAQRIFGFWADEVVGQHFSRFFSREEIDAGRPAADLEEAGVSGRLQRECWCFRRDGTRFRADLVLTALRDPVGTLTGFSNVTRDMGERGSIAHADLVPEMEELMLRLKRTALHLTELELPREGAIPLAELLTQSQQLDRLLQRGHAAAPQADKTVSSG